MLNAHEGEEVVMRYFREGLRILRDTPDGDVVVGTAVDVNLAQKVVDALNRESEECDLTLAEAS